MAGQLLFIAGLNQDEPTNAMPGGGGAPAPQVEPKSVKSDRRLGWAVAGLALAGLVVGALRK